MMPLVIRSSLAVLLSIAIPSPALAADIAVEQQQARNQLPGSRAIGAGSIAGHVAVIDGRTLWFPEHGRKVRLADIDACELPQWAYDPELPENSRIPKPVPCGPLAKAWLKRTVGRARIACSVLSYAADGAWIGRCTQNGSDIAVEMLRVGWARLNAPSPLRPEYLAGQQHAMAARYGMWATYVLDMDEWRAKAVDRTLARKPIADFNLLAKRESEISPPFGDARKRPTRTDR